VYVLLACIYRTYCDGTVIVKVPLFQDMPKDFLCELSMHVVRYVFSPGEVIIHTSEPVHEIYIVHRGICQVDTVQEAITSDQSCPCVGLTRGLGWEWVENFCF